MTRESITLFQQENKFKVHKIFITSKINSVFLVIIVVFRFFSRKQKKNKNLRLCYFPFFLFSIVSLKFQFINGFHFNSSLLQKLSKTRFFNLETLPPCHHIQHITLHKNFVFSAVTNLKHKNCPNFYKFLLLLSGDVSLNPEPIQRFPDINSTIWESLNKKRFAFPAYKHQELTFEKG